MRIVVAAVLALATIACGGRLFRQYEYEEEVYLSLDGSATIYVNGSVPALNALRGASFDARPNAPLDRAAVRAYFTTPVTRVTRVSASRRNNRRFVHVRLEVDDVRRLGEAGPFAWSAYQFSNDGRTVSYRQVLGGAAGTPAEHWPRSALRQAQGRPDQGRGTARSGSTVSAVEPWTGEQIVAFRLHLSSRIVFHNAGRDNPQRGNILAWEQPLADRLRGTPLTLEARMEPQSILYSTLLLFGATVVAVAAMFAVLIWWIRRRGALKGQRAKGRGLRAEG